MADGGIARRFAATAILALSCLGIVSPPSGTARADASVAASQLLYEGYYDLSDPSVQSQVVAQLNAAGLTQSQYPELFSSLAAAQALYAKAATLKIVIPLEVLATDASSLEPINEMVPSYTSSSQTLGATVSSTVANAYTIADAVTLMRDNTPLGPTVGSITVGGTSTMATASAQGANDATGYSGSGVIVYVVPASQLSASSQQALGLASTDPVALALPVQASILTPGSGYNIVNNAPTNVNKHNFMMLCIGRAGSNCDYSYEVGQPHEIEMPINGSITFPSPIKIDPGTGKPVSPLYNVAIWYPDVGGGCQMPSSTFADYVSASGSTLSWNANPGDFGTICSQYPYGQTVDVTYQLQVQVTSTSGTPMTATITTSQDTPPSNNTLVLLPMEFVYGCLAEGTMISMDGTPPQLPIENVQPRQMVLGPGHSKLEATAYWKGKASQLIQLVTANHFEVAMTANHPVPLANGVVKLAKHLVPGDRVTTIKGASAIATVREIAWTRPVWNLDLGAFTIDLYRPDMAKHSFFANGVLVGDGQAQIYFNRVAHRSVEETLNRLPAAWHTDFLHAYAWRQAHLRKSDVLQKNQK